MPRFFFHLWSDERVPDREGQYYPDLDAARRYAVDTIRALACLDVQAGYLRTGTRLDIEDEAGGVLASVSFRDAIELQG